MRKYIIVCFSLFLCLFFFEPLDVKADFGDVSYNVTNVIINDTKIKIQGYAFAHKTNNYVTIYKRDYKGNVDKNTIILDDGGQKVKIRAEDDKGNFIDKIYEGVNIDTPNDPKNYNFYFQMFSQYTWGPQLNVDTYNNPDYNKCTNSTSSKCYYEDLYFEITFTVSELLEKFGSSNKINFYITVGNKDYQSKDINGSYYANYVKLKIPRISGNSDNIEFNEWKLNGEAEFIASDAILSKIESESSYYNPIKYGKTGSVYNIFNLNESGYMYGFKSLRNPINTSEKRGFLSYTNNSGMYAICVKKSSSDYLGDGCTEVDENGYCTRCGGDIVGAYASWLSLTDESWLRLNIVAENKCEPITSSAGQLSCNGSKTFNSNCESLTVSTDNGSANVKIEQKGTISSVLTPDNIYAGGGFNFGVMYYNTIKWDFVNVPGNQELINAVTEEMNKRIKDYDKYIADLNINQISLGGKIISDGFFYKSCNTSNSNKDYYNKELTVSCIFHIPGSTIKQDGSVNYVYDSLGNGINNKYYTPLNYNGKYDIKASIEGMDRITSTYSKSDSTVDGKSWTGKWEDDFTNCSINLYGLLPSPYTKYIYRPIDISNPFPNRNAGINWLDWYDNRNNKEKLENTYNKLDYYAILNNQEIADIKMYNKEHNYLNWDSIDDYTGNSSFITEKDYINRVGDN